MPWNVVNKLENILIDLNKKDIETVELKDLERLIIENLGVTRETTINRNITILIKLNWIELIDGSEELFKILYKRKKEELF